MRTKLLLFGVAVVGALVSWRIWGGLLGPTPLGPARPVPTARDANYGHNITAAELRQLAERLPTPLVFDGSFSKSLDGLRDKSRLNIFVNWRSLEKAGVTRG